MTNITTILVSLKPFFVFGVHKICTCRLATIICNINLTIQALLHCKQTTYICHYLYIRSSIIANVLVCKVAVVGSYTHQIPYELEHIFNKFVTVYF